MKKKTIKAWANIRGSKIEFDSFGKPYIYKTKSVARYDKWICIDDLVPITITYKFKK